MCLRFEKTSSNLYDGGAMVNKSTFIHTTVFVIISTLIVGCGASKSIKQKIDESISCKTMPPSIAPQWVFTPIPQNEKYYYGIGVSDGFDKQFQSMKSMSKSNAEADLSSVIETRISSSIREDIKVNRTGNKEDLSKSVKQVIESNSDLLLSEVYVDEVWFNQDTCQLWTKVKLSRSHLEKSKTKMKTMILLELEKTSSDVRKIKEIVQEDPNVKLRKYGLTIGLHEYARALELDLPRGELFEILDLYGKYGASPYGAAFSLGFGYNQSHKSFLSRFQSERSFIPDFTSMNLIQSISAIQGGENSLEVLLEYSRKYKKNDFAVKFSDSARYDNWFKKEKEKLDYERKVITEKHNEIRENISAEYYRGRDRIKYDKRMEEFEREVSNSLAENLRKHNYFYDVKNQQKNRSKFNDELYTVHIAACYGTEKTLRLLESYGYSLNRKTSLGYTPLEVSEYCKNDKVIEYLN